ncbi:putative pentatricopeptide repeat-containing protein At5g37570 [Pyrus communis]|uniref:putative pentatricopeptide repeat-containing protein At5g37570 n=1 Tax=Pyrus communis TaxID=23211 RepID=UPI0035C16D94
MNHSLLKLVHKCQTLRPLKSIHAHLLVTGSFLSSHLILNKLLRLYSRFGAIDYARKLFDEITQPNSFLWTALIHGHVENRRYEEALSLFSQMHGESVGPLNFTFASVLKALARQSRVQDGEAIYGFVLKFGFGSDLTVQNAVIDLFMRCGKVDVARGVFDQMNEKDVVSWNSMISGYGGNGRVDVARELFDWMPERNTVSWTSMICGCVKSGDMAEARFLFEKMPTKDLVSWNVMISGYTDAGEIGNALSLFEAMPIREVGTWNLMISGLCKAGDIKLAEEFFNIMPNKNVASWTIMMDGYIKSGNITSARSLFDQMPEKNLVSWSTIIGGYAQNGEPRRALEMYKHFKELGVGPDETFVLGIISACSQLGVLGTAESIAGDFLGQSTLSNLQVVTSLIDMYAKCGSIERAVQIFEMARKKDLLCYSTMISAFANHGLGQDAISLFEEMKREGIKPDGICFLSVLSACNHAGLVTEGRRYFKQMTFEHGIHPSVKHYACVVDLLGRGGCLREAYKLILKMPFAAPSAVWGALLAACRVHRNVQLAEVAAAELFKIEPDNSGNYILLSNTYAAAGMWDGVAKVRALIREHGVRKNRGSSWIELGCEIHEFVMGDMSHFGSERIYLVLDLLREDMKLLGYLIDSEQKAELSSSENHTQVQ